MEGNGGKAQTRGNGARVIHGEPVKGDVDLVAIGEFPGCGDGREPGLLGVVEDGRGEGPAEIRVEPFRFTFGLEPGKAGLRPGKSAGDEPLALDALQAARRVVRPRGKDGEWDQAAGDQRQGAKANSAARGINQRP